jgi:dehydrogenase/reductase SDR family protein 12
MIRGATFFTSFLPSFSSIGYQARQRFWKALEPDFRGQRWLVTGASAGIGREIARAAAMAGAEVVVVARGAEALETLAVQVRRAGGAGRIEAVTADLSLVSRVDALGAHLAGAGAAFDVLINNVGVMFDRYRETEEGLDAAFVTNLLGQYLLTEQLLEAGCLADGAAVISMSSGGMYNVPLELERLQGGEPYDGTLAYAYHKRAQVVLNAHWRATRGASANFYVMHPGWVDTPGVETAMPEFHRAVGAVLRSVEAGADTALWLAGERPEQRRAEGIWFDRALRRVHALPGTRGGADGAELVAYLDRQAALARGEKRAA